MKITIKQIHGVLISTLMILGLAACSSSPSPWSQQDDSPWKSKRAAEAASAPADEFVEVQLEEPVPVAEPAYEPEPMVMPEPEPEPVPVMAPEPVVVAEDGDIMAVPNTSYAVQVYAGASESSVTRYRNSHGLDDLWTVKTDRDGSTMHVLVSIQPDRASANQEAADLEQRTGSKPWVRTVAGLQKIAIQ